MFAPSDQMYLPLLVIDVSTIKSDRRQAPPPVEREPRPSRTAGFMAAVQANVVRLIPGATRLPFEPAPR
jgi:hypothetical protein